MVSLLARLIGTTSIHMSVEYRQDINPAHYGR